MQKQDNARPYPTYDAYKDSGVEWLGEIPEHWEMRRFKYIFKEINEKSYSGSEDLLSVSQYTGVTRKLDRLGKDDILTNATSLEGYKKVKKGDLVSNIMLAWNGSLGFSPHDGITSPAYAIYRLIYNLSNTYFHHLLRTELYKNEFKRNSTGVIESRLRLYTDDFFNIYSILPPKSEQTAIANFLDEKCTKIKQAIAQKERLINLLQERKQIVIQTAVTKGLDPDVPMKDSGVAWIGEIPKHWEVKRLRYIGQTQNGISAGADFFGKGFPFVSYSDVYKNSELPKQFKGLANSTENDQKNYSIKEGDIIFTRTSETVDEIGFSSVCFQTIDHGTFAGFLIRFRPWKNILFKGFSKYFFRSNIHRGFFTKEMNLVTRASLSQEVLKNMPVLIPSKEEQKKIFEYLETQTTKIDTAIHLQRAQIEQLQVYQRSLIDSAVRGRIKVV